MQFLTFDLLAQLAPSFSEIVCNSLERVTGILPPSPDDVLHAFTLEHMELPFLGSGVTTIFMWDLYIILKLVLGYKLVSLLIARF